MATIPVRKTSIIDLLQSSFCDVSFYRIPDHINERALKLNQNTTLSIPTNERTNQSSTNHDSINEQLSTDNTQNTTIQFQNDVKSSNKKNVWGQFRNRDYFIEMHCG